MKLTIGKVLIVFCLVQLIQSEEFAQDVVEKSVEQEILEMQITDQQRSVENVQNNENEQATLAASTDSCFGSNAEAEDNAEQCKCDCADMTTVADNSAEVTTKSSQSEEETTTINTDDNQSAETTTVQASEEAEVESTSTTNEDDNETLDFTCLSIGNFSDPKDCRRYYTCTTTGDLFEVSANFCPAGQAFNTEFSSCMRDLSTCTRDLGGFECLEAGSFADPQNDTNSYYRCVPRLAQKPSTFHVYYVKCGVGKIFMPELGKCFFDFSVPQVGFNSKESSAMPDDEQLVKAELKQWKLMEKTKMKQQKMKLKYEKKLQKELAKKASKEAKAKAKQEEESKKGKTISYGKDNYDDDDDEN